MSSPGSAWSGRLAATRWALLFGNFAIGCGVMVVAGSLNDLTRSLQVSVALGGQLMASIGRHRPPARRLGGIRGLTAVACQHLHAHLVGGLAVNGLGSQAQQAQALFARPEALAAEQQDMTVEALCRHMPQRGHARVLPLHPGPGARLS